MHRIGVITTSRADFGIYQPVLHALRATGKLDVGLIATGQHLRPDMGYTIGEVERSGFPIWCRPEISVASDTPAGVAKTMGLCQLALADFFSAFEPIHLLLALGDRSEMLAAVSAAQPFHIPVAHLHGGEETEGAYDNSFRHAVTKLSHLHLVATPLSRERVLAMGENPGHVHLTGAPSLDKLAKPSGIGRKDLEDRFGLPATPFILATLHPETMPGEPGSAEEHAERQFETVMQALREFGAPVVFTASNSDTGGMAINRKIRETMAANSGLEMVFVENFGAASYFAAMGYALFMLGNTSSGILEAASFGLPVVNVGDRQRGRERSGNTIDVAYDKDAILAAMHKAGSDAFRAETRDMPNIYGDGLASPRIAAAIVDFLSGNASLRKPFFLDRGKVAGRT